MKQLHYFVCPVSELNKILKVSDQLLIFCKEYLNYVQIFGCIKIFINFILKNILFDWWLYKFEDQDFCIPSLSGLSKLV